MQSPPLRSFLAHAHENRAKVQVGPVLIQCLALCLALLCGGTVVSQQQPEASPAAVQRLKVLSYNIHHAEGVDGRLDLERIARVIRQSQADLVALQEVDQRVARSQSVDQAQQLAKLLDMHFAFGANIDLQEGHYGNAILSRYPINANQNHRLPNDNGGEQRGVLEADIALPDGVTLKFLSTHFDHRADPVQRLSSAKWINQKFADVDDQPVCLAGDLNAVPESSVLMELKKQWTLPNGQNQLTIPVDQPKRKIDYVLLSQLSAQPRWTTREVESRVLDEAIASDHRPVLSVLEIVSRQTL